MSLPDEPATGGPRNYSTRKWLSVAYSHPFQIIMKLVGVIPYGNMVHDWYLFRSLYTRVRRMKLVHRSV